MNPIPYLGVALVFFVLGCQAMPTVTRSGDVKDFIIGDRLASADIAVHPGDEIRWINKRTAPVRIVFIDPVSDKQLSCKYNIGGWMTPSDTAKLATNETASACFRDPGYIRYTLRMESALTTGEVNVSGVIKVGGQGGHAAGQPSDQNSGSASSDQSSGRTSGSTTDTPSAPTTSTTTTTTTTIMPPK